MPKTPEEIAADEAATAAAAAAAAGKDGKDGKSALSTGQETPEQWIPEKYHVRPEGKKDGPIDVNLSMRALAKGNAELTKRMVDIGLPPESADKYELEGLPKDFDVAEFRKDPQMADFLKGAHSQGLTNKQINYVIGKYIEAAPEIAGAAADLSSEECVSQLKLAWKSDAEFARNVKLSNVAATKLAAAIGLTYDDVDAAFGNNPLFIRLMAGLATQMGEDVLPADETGGGADGAGDFEAQAKALRDELDKIPERNKKERDVVQAKLNALYEKRYGKGQRAPFYIQPPRGAAAKPGGKAAA